VELPQQQPPSGVGILLPYALAHNCDAQGAFLAAFLLTPALNKR